MSDWAVHESGMISQSLTDIADASVRLFTETAMEHNQTIHDADADAHTQSRELAVMCA
jgi:hypothetical protein